MSHESKTHMTQDTNWCRCLTHMRRTGGGVLLVQVGILCAQPTCSLQNSLQIPSCSLRVRKWRDRECECEKRRERKRGREEERKREQVACSMQPRHHQQQHVWHEHVWHVLRQAASASRTMHPTSSAVTRQDVKRRAP
jgi:hypothetical protein